MLFDFPLQLMHPRAENVGKFLLDVLDHFGTEGNAVAGEQRIELGSGNNHFGNLWARIRLR